MRIVSPIRIDSDSLVKPAFVSIGILVGVIVLPSTLLYLFGRLQPERHTATITFALPKPPAVVWEALTDYAAMPQWWPAVKKVRFETPANGRIITWNTDNHGKEIGFRTLEENPPVRLVREIVGEDLPFGGTWTYVLAEEKGNTRLTLTEDGFIKSPFFRAIARLFLKSDATMHDFGKNFTAYVATK